jgi:hypothetical protein
MRFEVYCDEANPDVFTSSKPRARHLMIGSLWLPAELRDQLKRQIWELRAAHCVWGEIKWTKISTSRIDFYQALVDLFIGHGDSLRFRCIAVDHTQVDMGLHDNDGELGFYKFYYQLLHHWILDFNEYRIFCDLKTNREPTRIPILRDCLSSANLSSTIADIQSLRSSEVVLIQLCDFLLGAASSRMNGTLNAGGAKSMVVERLERALGRKLFATYKAEEKFNVFKIQLQGGW